MVKGFFENFLIVITGLFRDTGLANIDSGTVLESGIYHRRGFIHVAPTGTRFCLYIEYMLVVAKSHIGRQSLPFLSI